MLALVAVASAGLPESRIHANHRRGLPVLLDWLEEMPGRTWQQRWLASGADAANERWAAGPVRWLRGRGIYSASRLELMTSSLLVLVGAGVIRPSLAWLLTGGKKRKLARNMICSRDPDGFARLRQLCQDDPAITPAAQAKVVFRSAVIIAAKGGVLADVTIGDVLEVLDAERAVRARRHSGAATFRVLREMGIFGLGVPTLREILDTGQRTVEKLVDRYPIACRPVRDLIVDYLKERQPSIDYVTLQHRASQLARSFWADLEQHHPGIDTLRLPRDVASAWKQRLRTRSTTAISSTGEKTTVTTERLSYLDTLASVRAFYLDLAEWALDDPARGPRGWPRARSGQRTSSGASSPGAARRGWTPGPVTGSLSCRSWPAPPPAGVTIPRRCWPPRASPSRGSSSQPPGRPSSGPPGRTAIRATSGLATPPPARSSCSTGRKITPSGRGRSSKSCALPGCSPRVTRCGAS